MKTYIIGSIVLVLISILQDATGFGLPDFLHDLDSAIVARDTNPDNEAANVIIDVGLRLVDMNGDGVVTVEEARKTTDHIFKSIMYPGNESTSEDDLERFREDIGMIMTMFIVADADDSQSLGRTEMEKVARTLVREAGRAMAGKIIKGETSLLFDSGDMTLPTGVALVTMILEVADFNEDDMLSLEEADTFFSRGRLSWPWQQEYHVIFQEGDKNFDSQLNRQEIADLTKALGHEGRYFIRRIFNYHRILQLAGREIADLTLTSY